MSYEVYICHVCSGLIWFPWGEKTHLGTGWNCWKQVLEAEDELDIVSRLAEFSRSTPRVERERLAKQAESFYRQWRHNQQDKRLFKFLSAQLRQDRGDVVRRFLATRLREDAEGQDRLVDLLVTTPAWEKFVRRSRTAGSRKGKRRRRR